MSMFNLCLGIALIEDETFAILELAEFFITDMVIFRCENGNGIMPK